MSKEKQAIILPLVEELFNLVIKEGNGDQSDATSRNKLQLSPQIERLLEKLKSK